MPALLAIRLGMIGAGRMATALARGLVRAKVLPAANICASDPSPAACEAISRDVPGIQLQPSNQAAVDEANVVLLAVKPQQIAEALEQIGEVIPRDALVVSIAAGITLPRLAAGLPNGQRIVRVMPNTPCLIGRGASCFSLGQQATKDDAELVAALFSAVGVAFEVPEQQLDAVTGLSGSGPAFVYSMIEALTEGGTSGGLPSNLAAELAARTVSGAAEMVLQTGESPAVLRDRVTSPGGTTLAGLAALDTGNFRGVVSGAVTAATRRSAELGRSTP
jgi:pyrroline-5-carboxylate reductase